MEDDDWDLHAVVRGCAASTTSTAVTPTSNNPRPIFQPLPSHEDDPIPFDFPNITGDRKDTLQGLQDIYQQFCVDAPPPTAIPAAATCGSASVTEGQIFQPHQGIVQAQPPFQMNMQFQESIQYMNIGLGGSSSHYFPATNPQPSRPRRRKNQQMKIVHQMTQEELSADSWAWRKYGQKPIKGSSYPRNYYRCSTSKGCAARRQVERSPNDSGMFVVSYTGEHTHPRPAHRSSLAGSARCKFASAAANKDGNNSNAMLFQKGSISSSPASASGSSWSPRTPLVEREAVARNDDVEMAEEEDGGGDEDEENRIMSPSDLMNDDDGDQSSGGGDLFTSGLLSSPPWTSTSSAATWRR